MITKANNSLFTEGMGEFISQNYDKSIVLLSEFLESEPDHKVALISRGSAFLKINQIDEAANDLNRVIATTRSLSSSSWRMSYKFWARGRTNAEFIADSVRNAERQDDRRTHESRYFPALTPPISARLQGVIGIAARPLSSRL